MTKSKSAQQEVPSAGAGDPWPDMARMIEQFKLPGVDMSSVIEARRKDIEALVEANKKAYEGMQALARKQTEMFTQSMRDIQESAQSAAAGVGAGDPVKRADLARKAWERTLADMKDLADIAGKAQAQALATITQRAQEHQQALKKIVQPK